MCSLAIEDGTSQRPLMNQACHIDTVFGDGQRPYILPETLIVDELRAVMSQFVDISGSANTIRPALHSARYMQLQYDPRLIKMRERMEQRQYISLPYFYTFDDGKIVLTSGSSDTGMITIANDHHFEIHTIQVASTGVFSLNIVDVSQKESIIDAPGSDDYQVYSNLICGTAQWPFKFHEPRMIFAGQKLLVYVTDLSGSANTIYLTLGGRAIATRMWK